MKVIDYEMPEMECGNCDFQGECENYGCPYADDDDWGHSEFVVDPETGCH